MAGFAIMGEPPEQSTPPSVSKAFREWFLIAEPRFALPLVLKDHKDGGLEISILTKRAAIPAFLSDVEVTVRAMHDDECWDFFLSIDAAPVASSPGEFVCEMCEKEKRRVFPSVEALWRDHLFEPLLEWINTTLAPAKAMALFQSGGATWAMLFPSEAAARNSGAAFVVPL